MNAHRRSPEYERIAQYLSLHASQARLTKLLGEGTDGEVWATNQDTAVKAFKYERGYANERDTYLRLGEYGVTNQIAGFWIPKILGFDDDLKVIEMDLMQNPPYIIDFAKVKLNIGPDFSEDTIAQNELDGKELFGENWSAVKMLMAELESYLIFYLDPKPPIETPPAPADRPPPTQPLSAAALLRRPRQIRDPHGSLRRDRGAAGRRLLLE